SVVKSAYGIVQCLRFSQRQLDNAALVYITDNLIGSGRPFLRPVEFWVMLPDMFSLNQQGQKFIPRKFIIYIMGFLPQMVLLCLFIIKMGEHTFLNIFCLSSINNLVFLVFEKINSSFLGKFVYLFGGNMWRKCGLL